MQMIDASPQIDLTAQVGRGWPPSRTRLSVGITGRRIMRIGEVAWDSRRLARSLLHDPGESDGGKETPVGSRCVRGSDPDPAIADPLQARRNRRVIGLAGIPELDLNDDRWIDDEAAAAHRQQRVERRALRPRARARARPLGGARRPHGD